VIDGARQRTVIGSGVQLALVEAGDRASPTLVLVHGYPDTKELWDAVLASLAPRYHVVAYDVRGSGGSSAPRWPRSYDLERLADDLVAVIAATSPDSPVHLVGHDWGAIAGWEFATLARFDGKLASFTAIAGPSLDQIARGGDALLRRVRLLELARRIRRSWYVLGLCIPGVPTFVWRVVLTRRRWGWILQHLERLPADAASPAPTLARDATASSNLYRRNIPRRMLRPRRDAIARVPVQLILPSEDHFISPRYYADAERFAPHLRRRTIPGSHWAPRKHPQLLASWIAEFVEQVPGGTPAGVDALGTRIS
jgi:pimeloyl-ACP methyl ester carboxylesterase